MSIDVCSSFVVEPLQEYIEYWAKELEIDVEVNFAPYNQVFQQLLNSNSILHNNAGINILFVRLDDWLRDHLNLSSGEQIGMLDRTYSEFIEAVEYAQKNTVIPFLVSVVPLRPTHSFAPEVAAHIEGLNDSLQRAITKLPRFYLLDLQTVASLYSVDDRFDDMSDQVGHIPFSQEFYAAIGTYIMRKIRAYKGHSYKVIVLDCDNTLWKGVVGEIGALNVGIEGNFSYLQDFILEKYSQGFLIALCSKTNSFFCIRSGSTY